MNTNGDMKAIFIITNAGFATETMEIARRAGAKGATILNARGEVGAHKSFLGITVDTEKEILLILIESDTADKIIDAVHEKAGIKTPAHSICFVLPVDRTTEINQFKPTLAEPKIQD